MIYTGHGSSKSAHTASKGTLVSNEGGAGGPNWVCVLSPSSYGLIHREIYPNDRLRIFLCSRGRHCIEYNRLPARTRVNVNVCLVTSLLNLDAIVGKEIPRTKRILVRPTNSFPSQPSLCMFRLSFELTAMHDKLCVPLHPRSSIDHASLSNISAGYPACTWTRSRGATQSHNHRPRRLFLSPYVIANFSATCHNKQKHHIYN